VFDIVVSDVVSEEIKLFITLAVFKGIVLSESIGTFIVGIIVGTTKIRIRRILFLR
jgi:hypothetical protein